MYRRIVVMVLALVVAYGCSSGVKRDQPVQGDRNVITAVNAISTVSVSLTPEARSKVSDNLKFDKELLLSHVKRALDGKSMLLTEPDSTAPNLEIQVKDFRVRSNFSAVMWGFMAGSDSITGDVVLKNPAGQEVDRFEVSVSYALGGIGGGQDETRMSWMYEKFAEEVIKELDGKK